MNFTRRDFLALASAGTVAGLAACSRPSTQNANEESGGDEQEQPSVDLREFESLKLDEKAWLHDDDNDVYYQLGLTYCKEPASESLESLAIFVPGKYFTAKKSGSKYECTVNSEGTVGSFTAATAPIVMAINTGNLSPQSCPTSYSYSGLGDYLNAGCIYVYPGFRGHSSGYESGSSTDEVFSGGAPWPVVDLKAAVRYLRYNKDLLPCDTSRIFAMGFSEGGGVSAVLGSAGDSELYRPYLSQIGAITHDASGNDISDQIFGSASWCPITSYDTADASYEWMMGQYATDGDRADGTWTKLLSNDLATSYASALNGMGLADGDDNALTLDETPGVLYGDGSYYTYLTGQIQDAATGFFQSTSFPYTYTPQRITNPGFPGDPSLASSGSGTDLVSEVTSDASNATDASGAQAGETTNVNANANAAAAATPAQNGTTQVQSVQYATVSDYVSALNGDARWLTYNQSRGTARITGLGSFAQHVKGASRGVPAYDVPDRSSTANQLFGTDDESTLHFDQTAANLIAQHIDTYSAATNWDKKYVTEWGDDVAKTDKLNNTVATRVDMFNPLYFVCGAYEGFGSAKVAPHWRINTGLFQGETSLCGEANLALALSHYDGVSDVAFTPVWGQGHVLAERSGSATQNFLAWVAQCCAQ